MTFDRSLFPRGLAGALRAKRPAQVKYLETAALLGRRIAEQAIWYDGRCTWVEATLEDGRDAEATFTYATLGPEDPRLVLGEQ